MASTQIALKGVIENLQEALAAAQAAMANPVRAASVAEEIKTKMACMRFHLKAVK